jgi:hypothetical protein
MRAIPSAESVPSADQLLARGTVVAQKSAVPADTDAGTMTTLCLEWP